MQIHVNFMNTLVKHPNGYTKHTQTKQNSAEY